MTRKKRLPAEQQIRSGERGKRESGGFFSEPGLLALIGDCAACLFLAAGLGLGLFTATVIESGPVLCLLLTGVSVGLLCLFRLRWWIAPGLVLLTAAGYGGYHALCRQLWQRLSYWRDFVDWLGAGAPQHPVHSEGLGMLTVQWLVLFALSLGMFLFVRKCFFYPLLLAVVGGVFVTLYRLGYANPAQGLYLALVGLIILMPRMYHRHVLRLYPREAEVGRGPMQVIAIPLALLAVAGAVLVTGEDTSGWRSRTLVNLVDDVAYLLEGPFSTPRASGGFHLRRAGYQPLEDRLGGPVELEDIKAFSVQTQQPPFLLKGSVEDYYDGKNWRDSRFDGDFRLTGLFWRGYRNTAFSHDLPLGGKEAQALYDAMSEKVSYNMIYQNAFKAIFSAGKVQRVELMNSSIELQPYFDMQGELYAHDWLRGAQRAEVETRILRRQTERFDDNMMALEELMKEEQDGRYREIAARYTQLPEDYSPAVRELTAQIVNKEDTPYQRARGIEDWLREQCAYTLQPEIPPEDMDFVEHFLYTREGYCTYYASAMAVMARCTGIPSRYVSGFGLQADSDSAARYQASNRTAHAWAELYFAGIGWVEFDPLNWSSGLVEEQEQPEADEESPAAAGKGEAAHPERNEELPQPDDEPGEPDTPPWTIPTIAILALLGYGGGRLGGRWLLSLPHRRYLPERHLRRYTGPGEAFDGYYADILRLLALLGVETSGGETLTALARRVDRQVRAQLEEQGQDGEQSPSMATVCAIRTRLHYGELPPSQEDLTETWRYHVLLEDLVRIRLGDRRYLWRRVLRMAPPVR